jgi:valyl-tRNA synthetase
LPGKLWEIRYPVIGHGRVHRRGDHASGDDAGRYRVAVNPKDERYTHLHGKKVLLPLMNREIPIITDELAKPEFGTGAVKVTPAHDPNDFQAGLRHNLPQIDVMDEHAHMNENAGPYAGLDRYEARKRVLEDLRSRDSWSAKRITRCARQVRSLRKTWSSRGFRRSGSSRSSRWPIARSKWSRAARSRLSRKTTSRFI